MNCSNCKNPVRKSDSLCEWCGEIVEPIINNSNRINITEEKKAEFIQFFVHYKGLPLAIGKFHVYVDGVLIGIGSCRKGFELSFKTINQRPQMIIKAPPVPWNKKIEMPESILYESGSKYMIQLGVTIWNSYGVKSKPIVTKLKSL